VEGKEKLPNLKLDGFKKHLGKRKALVTHPKIVMGEYYQSFENRHQKNERIHVIQGLESILQLMLNERRAKEKKKFSLWQFSTF
jgi:hypothetical protein